MIRSWKENNTLREAENYRGESLWAEDENLPEEFEPVFIWTDDKSDLESIELRMDRKVARILDKEEPSPIRLKYLFKDTYSMNDNCSIYYNGKFYRVFELIIHKKGKGRKKDISRLGGVKEYDVSEVEDWEYLGDYKPIYEEPFTDERVEEDYVLAKHPAVKELIEKAKKDPSILMDCAEKTKDYLKNYFHN